LTKHSKKEKKVKHNITTQQWTYEIAVQQSTEQLTSKQCLTVIYKFHIRSLKYFHKTSIHADTVCLGYRRAVDCDYQLKLACRRRRLVAAAARHAAADADESEVDQRAADSKHKQLKGKRCLRHCDRRQI